MNITTFNSNVGNLRIAPYNNGASDSTSDDSNMLSLATLNIKGYKDATKFSSILSDIQHKNLTLVGLTETHMPAATASILFREYWATQTSCSPYTAFWDYNPKDKSSGVGLWSTIPLVLLSKKSFDTLAVISP